MEAITNLMSGVTTLSLHALRLVLITTYAQYMPYQFEYGSASQPIYDFIVVGAGSSGSVVAARLAETGATVLLLEAGPSAPPESAVPGLNPLLIGGDRDWMMHTAPQKFTQFGYNRNSVPLPLGRSMGGGSSINGLQYVRGSPQDFDHWAALGNTGWDYRSVLPYFKKSEDFRGKVTAKTARFHGRGGPYPVEPKLYNTPVQAAFLKAGQELGFSVIDPSGPRQIGFASPFVTIRNGIRSSVSESFLRPIARKKNLHIRPRTMVTRILFNKDNRAIGVRYQYRKEMRVAHVTKEVIVCAGAINSPKLLMLSGVGPSQHLSKMGIPMVAAVEGVGRNLNDHHVVNTLVWSVKRGTAMPLKAFTNPHNYINYAHNHKGFLSAPFAIEGNAWANFGGDYDSDWPNVQLYVSSAGPNYDGGSSSINFSGLRKEYFSNLYGSLVHAESLQLGPMLSRPKSRGRVLLRSRNPYVDPIIDPNFLDHPDDTKAIIEGIKFAIAIGNTTALRKGIGAKLHFKPLIGCQHLPAFSDLYWECYARHLLTTFWHPVGTCKMAPYTDPMGVVSPRLRLRGVKAIRVVDASIMPQIVTGNTMATSVMIGERGADIIKEDWGYPTDELH